MFCHGENESSYFGGSVCRLAFNVLCGIRDRWGHIAFKHAILAYYGRISDVFFFLVRMAATTVIYIYSSHTERLYNGNDVFNFILHFVLLFMKTCLPFFVSFFSFITALQRRSSDFIQYNDIRKYFQPISKHCWVLSTYNNEIGDDNESTM